MKTIEYSKQVYSIRNIKAVANVYRDYATILIKDIGDRVSVTFEKCRFSEKRTVKEFENYLIGVENSNGNN